MKKLAALGLGLLLSASAFANDPIVGTWKMSEKGQEKAIIVISGDANGYSGKVTKGLTEKAKKTEGKVALTNIKATEDGKYKGKGIHPATGIKANVTITVNGDKITIKSLIGTQTGVRQ